MFYIGIDLGTSSLKILLLNSSGLVEKTVSRDYPLAFPRPNWSEQKPEDWWHAVVSGLKELVCGIDTSLIAGIGCAGQMHGLVILDENDEVIRPAILWNDGRTSKEVEWLNCEIGKSVLSSHTANIAFAGFTAPKLLWLKDNEPENFARIKKIMLPKDYINYMLTGVHCCDYSDASGMLLLDVKNRCWSEKMLELCSLSMERMPALYESYELIGTLLPEIAEKLNLPCEVKVCAGAGDNAAAAIGTGTLGSGKCNISIGTSGTVFISSDKFTVDPNNALHAFAHADGSYHLMACILSAASCNKWFVQDILKSDDYENEQIEIPEEKLGRNNIFFLPYLMGERSPINDTDARACFVGMSLDTSRADMVQAVLEGVAFAVRDCFEVARAAGINISQATICGGGSKSALWLKIMANVLGIVLDIPETEQGPGYGAAILAMTACGEYENLTQATGRLVSVKNSIYPSPELTALYQQRYSKFREIYPACKELFQKLASPN